MSEISKRELESTTLLCDEELYSDQLQTNLRTRLLAHIDMEARIGRRYKMCTFAHWFFYVYWAEIVFRNFAFLRVEQSVRLGYMKPHRLFDIGQEITSGAQWDAFGQIFSEQPLYVLTMYCLLMPLLSFVLRSKPIY